MTRDEGNGRCVVIPVNLGGLAAVWVTAVMLITWNTFGGPDVAGRWGLLFAAAAVAWTAVHQSQHQNRLLLESYRAGVEEGVRHMSAVR